MNIKFAYGIVPGTEDIGQEAECRDRIRTAYENGVAVIFLAGPAAGIAAELTAERFDELYASENAYIKETLSDNTADGGLLFIAVKGGRYLAGHMGGGLIVRLDGNGSVLSKPEAKDHDELRIYRGEARSPFGFMLMSEGACRSLYESDTGNLSPACGTFFEWLKEYDEETVSEALTDNISRYFLKDVKGDISVGIMVSEEDETEPEEETAGAVEPKEELQEAIESEDKPAGESRKSGGMIKYLVAALVVLAVIFVFAMKPGVTEPKDTAKPEPKPPAASSENTGTPASGAAVNTPANPVSTEPGVTFSVDDPVSYDAGVYQVGEDIPAGEYFFWNGEMLKPDSIKVNDVTCLSGKLYCMTIKVSEGDTLTTDARFTSAENVNPVKAEGGALISGKYKIGKDIAPGTYKIRPADQNTEGKYYSILEGEISNDETFRGETTVVVPEEGYIVFYNAVLDVAGK